MLLRFTVEKLWNLIGNEERYIKSGNAVKFSEKLLNNNRINKKLVALTIVKEWGGIKNYEKVPEAIITERDECLDDLQYFRSLGERISSWSKILAFSNPGKYQIYDSRVANALNTILGTSYFMEPEPKVSPKNSEYKKNYESNKRVQMDVPNSYKEYLELVDKLARKIAHPIDGKLCDEHELTVLKHKIEMTLFQMGRMIPRDEMDTYYSDIVSDENFKNKDKNMIDSYDSIVAIIQELESSPR